MINGHMIHALVCLEQTNELFEAKNMYTDNVAKKRFHPVSFYRQE